MKTAAQNLRIWGAENSLHGHTPTWRDLPGRRRREHSGETRWAADAGPWAQRLWWGQQSWPSPCPPVQLVGGGHWGKPQPSCTSYQTGLVSLPPPRGRGPVRLDSPCGPGKQMRVEGPSWLLTPRPGGRACPRLETELLLVCHLLGDLGLGPPTPATPSLGFKILVPGQPLASLISKALWSILHTVVCYL